MRIFAGNHHNDYDDASAEFDVRAVTAIDGNSRAGL
jgi:hypothetical protein